MKDADTIAVLKAAHKQGMPPIPFSVLAGLLSYANWKGMCHPGQRALAKLCSINKDTVTVTVNWLAEHKVIAIYKKPRSLNVYEILARSKWTLGTVRSGRTDKKCHLSGSTAQFTVRSGRTDKIAIFRVNCPAPSDVIKDSAQGANGAAFAAGSVEEPSASPKLAFP